MTRYLILSEVMDIHRWALQGFGGLEGVRDQGLLESALAAPLMTFGGVELHATLFEKAAALAYSLIMNHAFVDGNKRVGFWATDTFLRLNGQCVSCGAEEGEAICLAVAAGNRTKEQLYEWLTAHCHPLPPVSEARQGSS